MAVAYEDMIVEKADGIGTVILNRPEKLNALTDGIRRGLRQVIRDMQDDDNVRVVIITGAGDRGFCSGQDVRPSGSAGKGDLSYRKGPLSAPVLMLRDLDKLVIGAINGVAAGAGFGLALACDIRIASDNASFINAFIRRGLAAGWGLTYWLPRMVGMSKALEILCSGERVDAQEALRLGLVSKVVPAADLMSEARALAAKIAGQPPMSVQFIKRLSYEGLQDTLKAHLSYEVQCGDILSQTEDLKEAIQAAAEKRQPVFRGL